MQRTRRHLELLAPAKNADFGIEAINHGADAVYIGGPAFGARAKAPNTVADIERLVKHAHRYHAEVFVALNTIFHDNELEGVRELVHQLYDIGTDALIVQDMGLLEMDLPPIQLHASTQTDIRTVEKAVFLDQVGFSQLVLARELDLTPSKKSLMPLRRTWNTSSMAPYASPLAASVTSATLTPAVAPTAGNARRSVACRLHWKIKRVASSAKISTFSQ